jgi:hypothetical protein
MSDPDDVNHFALANVRPDHLGGLHPLERTQTCKGRPGALFNPVHQAWSEPRGENGAVVFHDRPRKVPEKAGRLGLQELRWNPRHGGGRGETGEQQYENEPDVALHDRDPLHRVWELVANLLAPQLTAAPGVDSTFAPRAHRMLTGEKRNELSFRPEQVRLVLNLGTALSPLIKWAPSVVSIWGLDGTLRYGYALLQQKQVSGVCLA